MRIETKPCGSPPPACFMKTDPNFVWATPVAKIWAGEQKTDIVDARPVVAEIGSADVPVKQVLAAVSAVFDHPYRAARRLLR